MVTRNTLVSAILAAILLITAGCNYPGMTPPGAAPLPAEALPAEALRRTLQAQGATATVAPAGPTEAVTGLPPWPTAAPSSIPPTRPPAATPPGARPGYSAYTARPGDTLEALAERFDVEPGQIILPAGSVFAGYLPAGLVVEIPAFTAPATPGDLLLPDSEVVYSPTSAGFDVAAYIQAAGGYLASYRAEVNGALLSGAEIVLHAAEDQSVNPRLLLALIEYRSGWVSGVPVSPGDGEHPLGFYIAGRAGLDEEVRIAATQLSLAYYGWRQGSFKRIEYRDPLQERLNPGLNAGSVAIQHLFALMYRRPDWQPALTGGRGFMALYAQMFGDPWVRDAALGPLLPDGLGQPALELPFRSGERWSLTAGPHPAWNTTTPRGALDLAPTSGGANCTVAPAWVTAAAPGVIARARDNAVILDLDGDGLEQTGWVVFYFHIAGQGMAAPGTHVAQDDPIGHPSCEGGRATGTHVHIARKYNGEWLAADGPLPFVLSGWTAHADPRNYYGSLTRDGETAVSNVNGAGTSIVTR